MSVGSRTGFVHAPVFVEHDTGSAHPERPGRLTALHARFDDTGLTGELDAGAPRGATQDELARVHAPAHIARVRDVSASAASSGLATVALDGDTNASGRSYDVATRAAGGLILACERVLDGVWSNAFCAVRPPGHHAESDRAMGFCLFNNVAVAAAALRARGLERVAIVDWDVHHGNGTQHLFEDDPSVFYASLHQWPLYPGTGAAEERGRADGEGATLNVPMAAGSNDRDWLGVMEERVLPALEAFAPEFVLISAGFDAHRLDPLSGVELTEEAYRGMTRGLLDLAQRTASGRLVSVLEGGYSLEGLSLSAAAHVGELVTGNAPHAG